MNIANTQLPQPNYNDKPHIHQRTLSDQLLLSRFPAPEPGVFSGDPLHCPSWKSAFHALIESRVFLPSERIHYLKRYLAGTAKETIESYFLLMTDDAYEDAKLLLDERFGDPFVIAYSFRNKLDRWPKIASRDETAMRKFADFLKQCTTAMGYTRSLDVLNDDRENRKLLCKLPDWLVNGWARYVYNWKTGNGCFPPFAEFASFVSREADIACDPITSLQSLRGSDDASKTREDRTKSHASSSFSTYAKIKTLDNDTRSKCTLCQGNHPLDNCKTFLAKPLQERKTFAMLKGLCFGCMEPGHRSKECKMRKSCKTCAKRHPSSLHGDIRRDAREMITTSRKSISTQTSICHCNSSNCCKKSSIVPMWVSHSGRPDYERLVCALLDTQPDTTFILNDSCAAMGVDGTPVQLSLSMMSASNQIIQSSRINGLHVRAYSGDSTIALPPTYTRDIIPTNREHVPTLSMAQR